MRPRDWFLVGVRLIGVWALFRAFEVLWPILGVWLQLTSISGPGFRAMNGMGVYSAWQVGGYVATAALFYSARSGSRESCSQSGACRPRRNGW